MKHTTYLLVLVIAVFTLLISAYWGMVEYRKDVSLSVYPKTVVSLATGGTSGTYFSIGSGMAAIITKNVEGVEVIAESTGASIANCTMMREGEVTLTLASASTAYSAYYGEGIFEGQPADNMRGLMALYPEVFHFVVLESSGIETIGDLNGKRISIGEKDSGTSRIASVILEGHNLSSNQIELSYMSFSESIGALKDGHVDCIVFGSGIPTAAVVDAAANMDINLLEVERELMDSVISNNKYLNYETIAEGVYSDVNKDILTVSTPALLIASKEVSDDVAYEITKAIFNNLSELEKIHYQARNIDEKNALQSMSIPLHPGAEKYYFERKILE